MQDTILKIVQTVNLYLSDYILMFLLTGVGLFFTVRTRFVQVRCFGEGVHRIFGKSAISNTKKGGLSSFQALATAIAAQVGTGNIIGACGAILIGGPGAIFWMWIIAFLGMSTVYAEAVLAQKTRTTDSDGTLHGGPVYYIKAAFNNKFGKFLAGFFAVATVLALGFMGAMVQSNSIVETCNTAFGISPYIIGVVLAIAAGFVFIGNVQRLASVTEKVVPIMAIFYIIGGLIVIAVRIKYIPETIGLIFKSAFAPHAVFGGAVGITLKKALTQGAKRGLFSNEAGMGSTPHAHALADAESPHAQGTVAMVGVFIDTFIVLTMTALVVISTLYAGNGALADGSSSGIEKTNMAQLAFSSVFGTTIGNAFVAICMLFFAFSTIISWNMFGKTNIEYLFGKKALIPYSILAILFTFAGACLKNDIVWELTDMFNQLMCCQMQSR